MGMSARRDARSRSAIVMVMPEMEQMDQRVDAPDRPHDQQARAASELKHIRKKVEKADPEKRPGADQIEEPGVPADPGREDRQPA